MQVSMLRRCLFTNGRVTRFCLATTHHPHHVTYLCGPDLMFDVAMVTGGTTSELPRSYSAATSRRSAAPSRPLTQRSKTTLGSSSGEDRTTPRASYVALLRVGACDDARTQDARSGPVILPRCRHRAPRILPHCG